MSSSNRAVDGIVVGGAGGAVGQVLVQHLLTAGYRVHAVYRDRVPLLAAQPQLSTHCCDLSDGEEVQKLVAHLIAQHGGIGAVINAAGAFVWTKTVDCSNADFEALVASNFKSTFFLVRNILPPLLEQRRGRIVLISAAATLHGGATGMGVYSASKSALNALLASTAVELRGSGVTINALCPTIIDTPRNRREMPKADFSTWISTATISATIDLLLSAGGAHINGAVIPLQ